MGVPLFISICIAILLDSARCDTYSINATALGRTFTGIGAISGGGATSRLLVSYPDEQLTELLDYLFLPNFAASLQILKVEMGGDGQSTDGAEASHMHTADDLNYERGYEWWLMTEAKKRNPNIKFYALPWAFPAWVGNGTSNPYAYPELTVSYVLQWINGAKTVYDLDIDYVGIWNERGYNTTYITMLRSALDDAGFNSTMIVAPDELSWDIAADILADPTVAEAVYAIGSHYPGTVSTPAAVATNKPLWASEDMSTFNDLRGAGCWTRILNQNYVNGNMTTTIGWNLISSYYAGLPWYGTALMTASEPWSGSYDTENVGLVWATAHTTQFTQPGWIYLQQGQGSGFLTSGGSYVTLINGSDFTIVIEKMSWAHSQCTRPPINDYEVTSEWTTFTLDGNWSYPLTLHVWHTWFGWDGTFQANSTFFEPLTSITVTNGSFSLTINPDDLYTVTTLNTGYRAEISSSPDSQPFPSSYADDFEGYNVSSEARYFTDQAGIFEIYDSNSPHGLVMRQAVPQVPIRWDGDYAPFTIIGDVKWGDTLVSAEVLVEETGTAFIGARCGTCCYPGGVFFGVSVDQQAWLLTNTLNMERAFALVSGPMVVEPNVWYNLSLSVVGTAVDATVNGDQVVNGYQLAYVSSGWAAMGTSLLQPSNYTTAQFDNFAVSAFEFQCPSPTENSFLILMQCGSPNEENTQWVLADNGQIQVRSDPTLCVSTGAKGLLGYVPLFIAACAVNDTAQIFSIVNSTSDPTSNIFQGASAIGFVGNFLVGYPPSVGAGLYNCNSSNPGQQITFTGGQYQFGVIVNAAGHCLTGLCSAQSCYPSPFVTCNTSDPHQQWTHTFYNTFVNDATGDCLDAYNEVGPQVGLLPCSGSPGQTWQIGADYISSLHMTGQCLSVASFPSTNAASFMLDEFGGGEITVFNDNVANQCVGVCSALTHQK